MKKKILLLGVVLIMFFSLVACGGKATVPDEPTHPQTEGDFILTISVDEDTFRCGKDIKIEAVFENISGKEVYVSHSTPFIELRILKSEWYDGPSLTDIQISALSVDEIIEDSRQMGSKLPKGKHELIAVASFDLYSKNPEEHTFDENRENHMGNFRIYSNTIILTVK